MASQHVAPQGLSGHSKTHTKNHRRGAFLRSLRFESLELRALLAADFSGGLSGLELLDSQEQRESAMKEALDEQQVVGLEDHVASKLLDVYRQYANAYEQAAPAQPQAAESIAATTAFPEDSFVWSQPAESRVGVRVIISDDAQFSAVTSRLSLLGYEEFASDSRYLLSEGSLPIWAIPEASETLGVAALDVMYKPMVATGLVTTQADAELNADDVRTGPPGYTGAGVKVGVLSDSASRVGGGLADSQATGDLPASVEILRDGPGFSDEGRAMMELVHDIAPDASLSFRSAFWGELDFARGINELAAAGADIIVDDIFYYAEPMFADGPIAQAVNHVVNTHGVSYFSLAGNHADHSYESIYRDNNPNSAISSFSFASGANLHDFDPGPGVDLTLSFTVSGSGWIPITLQWDQPWYKAGETVSDFNMYVYNDVGGFVTSATRANQTYRQPFEYLEVTAGTYNLQINHVTGPEAVRLKLMAFTNGRGFVQNEYTSDGGKGTLIGHAAALGAAAVAAAPYSTYSSTGAIEPYSSRGQPTLYFDSEYRRLVTPETRNKPDITAPDGGNTSFFGFDDDDFDFFPNFYGTSAAAPDAAAVAALLLQQRPTLSPSQVYQVLASTSTDRGAVGWDPVHGAGNIDALAASTALNTSSNFPDVTGPLATEYSVQSSGAYPVDKFTIWFNEELDATAANSASNYEIRNAGVDGLFGTGDDSTYSLTATYTDATRSVLVDPSGSLGQGRYRVMLKSGAAFLRDTTGNQLNAGTDQTYDFTITNSDRERVLDQREFNLSWPDVAINSANQGVAVWTDSTGFTNLVFVQRYDETGEPLWQSPLALQGYANFIDNRYYILPSVSMAEDGRFVVAYEGFSNTSFGNYRAAYVQRFNADGTLLGDPIRVDTDFAVTSSHQGAPDVSIMPDGSKFVVVWEDGGNPDPLKRIEGIVYNWDATPATSVLNINTTALGQTANHLSFQAEPAVAINSSGNWVAGWSRFDASGSFTVYSQLYDVNGNALSSEINVATVASPPFSWDPDVAIDDSGNFNVVYGANEVNVSRYNSFGVLREAPFQVNTTTSNTQANPAIAIERDSGDFVVTWRSTGQDLTSTATSGVVARQYNDSATPLTGEFLLNETTAYHESFPAVAMDTDGDIWTAWVGTQGEPPFSVEVGHAIYGRWLPAWANTSLSDVVPVSLAVDGQPVPGEKVDVRLTLHNPSFVSTGTFAVQFYLSTDSTITPADQPLGSPYSVASLTPGLTRAGNFSVQLPASLAQASGYIGVLVDSDGLLTESDEVVDSNQTSTVTISVSDAVSDDAFDTVSDQSVSVTTIDNDTPGFTIVQSAGSSSVHESGTTDTFTVVLNKRPASSVQLTVVSGNTGEATVSSGILTFTTANWSTPQTVTLTGINDALTDGNQISTITVAVNDATSDNAYDPLPDQLFSVTTLDNDGPGFTIVESNSSTIVGEGGSTDSFTVVLNAAPTVNVVLTVTSGDTGEVTVSPATLTFTSGNWNVPQTVMVKGINDILVDGKQTSSITVSVNDAASDDAYDAVADQTVSVATLDDEPSFLIVESGISTSVNEGFLKDTFTVALGAPPSSNVVLTLASGNSAEAAVSPATLTFTAANWNTPQTVTVTGVNDDFGNTAAQAVKLQRGPQVSGAETRVNTTTAVTQQLPNLAMDDLGRFVVTWSGNGTGDSDGVFFQRYDALGQPQGSETRVNTNTTSVQTDAMVAMNKSTGDFAVVWTGTQSGNNDIYFQRYNSSGVAQGSETIVNTTTANNQLDPAIAMDDSGNFVVVWTSGSPTDIFARRFNNLGVALSGEFQADTASYIGGGTNQASPSVSMDSSGNFVVAWRSSSEESNGAFGIYFQRFDISGSRIGSQTHANAYLPNSQDRPAVALGDDGKVIVAWTSLGQEQVGTSETASDGIYFQRFDSNNFLLSAGATGTYDSSDIRANAYVTGNQQLPSIALGSDGRFAIAWDSLGQDGDLQGVYYRKYNADGSADGGARQANTYTTEEQTNPSIALGPDNNVVMTWMSMRQDGSAEGIYMQRFAMEGGAASRLEDFESGSLNRSYWETYSTNEGRVQVTADFTPHSTIDFETDVGNFGSLNINNAYGGGFQLQLDDTTDNDTYSLNEAVMHVNLAGLTNMIFSFWEKAADTAGGNGDEFHLMSETFTGHENSDGVAISADGTTWYRIWSEASTSLYTRHSFSLNAVVAAIQVINPAFALTNDTQIKFQQYDNAPAATDGLFFDDIQLTRPKVWDGGGATNNWSDAANWSDNTVPLATDHVLFNATSTKASNIDTSFAGTVASLLLDTGYTNVITQFRSLTIDTGGQLYVADGAYFVSNFILNLRGSLVQAGSGQLFLGPGIVNLTGGSGLAASIGPGDTVLVTGSLALTDGRILDGTIEARGNVTVGTAFDAGTTTKLNLTGNATQTLNLEPPGTDKFDGDILIDKTGGVVNLVSQLTMDGGGQDLTLASSTSILNVGGNNLTMTDGIFSNEGTVRVNGLTTQTVSLTPDIDSGTWEYRGDGDGLADTHRLFEFGSTDYFNLKINAIDANDTFQSAAGSPKVIAGALSILNGSISANSNNVTFGSLAGTGGTTGSLSLGTGLLTTGNDNTHTVYNGVISGSGGLAKMGTGSFYVGGNNSFTGETIISDGSILVSSNNGLGTTAGGTTILPGSNARLVFERSVNYFTPEPVTINGSGFNGNGSLLGVGNSTFAGPITLGSASTIGSNPAGYALTLNGPINNGGNLLTITGSGNTNINGVISGSGGLTKVGTGTLALNNANTYTGPTAFSAGTVRVNGSIDAASAVTVDANGTLAGTGSLGSITANGNGIVAPGNGLGMLSASSVDLSSGGSLRIQLQGYSTPGTSYDRLNLSGTLTTGGTSKLILDLAGLTTTGTATGIVLSAAQTGSFTTVQIFNNPNNYFACLEYTGTSVNLSMQTGACGTSISSGVIGGAVGSLDDELAATRAFVAASQTVAVANLDSGVDYTHPALYQNVWLNEKEIPAAVRERLKDTDGDRRITLRDLNRPQNQGKNRITDLNNNGVIDGGDVLRAWSDGRDDDRNGYVDDLIGWDFVNNDNDPSDDSGHGTHAAGIIVQVAPRAEILPLKFLDANAGGSLTHASRALDYALSQNVTISSNGWAASVFSQEWLDELHKAEAAGHLFVTSAGNGDPALLEILGRLHLSNVLVVTAEDSFGQLTAFSNWDPNIVDVSAPGVGVISTLPGGKYGARSGTSVSTAYVAGLAALLHGNATNLDQTQLIDAVLQDESFADLESGKVKHRSAEFALAADAYYASLRQGNSQNSEADSKRIARLLWGKSATR